MATHRDNDSNNRQFQQGHAGRDNQIIGGNYTNTTSINISLWISIAVITIVALGSYVVFNTEGILPKLEPAPNLEQS
ncbi:MAG: hypothetical protein AAFZ80_10655 [Cyanobacteria bacterium P01_A01_bin.105]